MHGSEDRYGHWPGSASGDSLRVAQVISLQGEQIARAAFKQFAAALATITPGIPDRIAPDRLWTIDLMGGRRYHAPEHHKET